MLRRTGRSPNIVWGMKHRSKYHKIKVEEISDITVKFLEVTVWNMVPVLSQAEVKQCGFIEHRSLISHDSLSKSAQYLRSSLTLV